MKSEDTNWYPPSDALMDKLRAAIPPYEPDFDHSDREIFYEIGRRDVVKMLETWKKWGEEEDA